MKRVEIHLEVEDGFIPRLAEAVGELIDHDEPTKIGLFDIPGEQVGTYIKVPVRIIAIGISNP